MPKINRKKRQEMAADNNIGKYLKYAIGEIVLVVLGILIAFQIDSWNENRQESKSEEMYLSRIKDDLEKDIQQTDAIISMYTKQLNVVKLIVRNFDLDAQFEIQSVDTSLVPFSDLFRREKSFHSTKGTYSSLISDGKAHLIKNKELFQNIQIVYDELHLRIYSIYEALKTRQGEMTWQYSYEKLNWDYSVLKMADNRKIKADLANYWEVAQSYCLYLQDLKVHVTEIINEINKELK